MYVAEFYNKAFQAGIATRTTAFLNPYASWVTALFSSNMTNAMRAATGSLFAELSLPASFQAWAQGPVSSVAGTDANAAMAYAYDAASLAAVAIATLASRGVNPTNGGELLKVTLL